MNDKVILLCWWLSRETTNHFVFPTEGEYRVNFNVSLENNRFQATTTVSIQRPKRKIDITAWNWLRVQSRDVLMHELASARVFLDDPKIRAIILKNLVPLLTDFKQSTQSAWLRQTLKEKGVDERTVRKEGR